MPKYQIALSFAGEQRDYVERVARWLQARGVALFYDKFETINLWGKDGVEFFHQLFSKEASFVVMFISAEYVAKKWTRHERRSALSKAIAEVGEYVLPVRFDSTPVPGLPDTIQYLNAADYAPEALGAALAKRIGLPALMGKASDVPPPQMTSNVGEAVFDYSSFNGRYKIGDGPLLFETKWSRASGERIHILNDPPSIHGVAIAKGARRISDVLDASKLDFTSRTRTPNEGEIVVLQNSQGFYAALKIVDVKDDRRQGDDCDEVRFNYAIQTDGSPSFAEFRSIEEDAT